MMQPTEGLGQTRPSPRLAIDKAAHRLFPTCLNAVMNVVDTDSGKVVASLPIGQGTDGAAFDPTRKAFMQSYGSNHLDASTLLIPLVGFLPASDPRVQGTVHAVEKQLCRHGFVLRYSTDENGSDGLPPGEGAFLACTFWLADNYALAGRSEDARKLFHRLLSIRNDLGLLAEEYDPVARRQLGNFPQAFSHVGLINTALNLTPEQPTPAEERGRNGAS